MQPLIPGQPGLFFTDRFPQGGKHLPLVLPALVRKSGRCVRAGRQWDFRESPYPLNGLVKKFPIFLADRTSPGIQDWSRGAPRSW